MGDSAEKIADLHVRIGRVESALERAIAARVERGSRLQIGLSALLALVLSVLGFHFPNHWYQGLFGLLIVALLVQRGKLASPRGLYSWALQAVNVLIISMTLKLFIGGGDPRPFWWMQVPTIEGGLSHFRITWSETAVSHFSVPLTVIQTFFLILVVFSSVMELYVFSSLLAFLLVVVSLPALVQFDWTWAIPALVATGVTLYLQIGWKSSLTAANGTHP